jgi:cysteine desulfurase / selenocysteine lyase
MNANFDIAAIRREFPITQRILYFDSAHQAPLSVCVKAALESFFTEGLETAGPKSRWLARVEDVRARLAQLIGAEPSEIAFTKNTSEGLNIAANALPLTAGDNVLLAEGDHPNTAYAFLNLRAKGINVRFLAMGEEAVDAASFAPHIDACTRAVSLSHVMFHAGHLSDITGIGRLCEKRIHLVVDATQSVGVMPLDVGALPPSMIAFGCHKGLLVPQGLGVLYASKSLPEMRPAYLALAGLAHPPDDLVARPDNMELKPGAQRFEIGNYNLPDIHALGAALDLIERAGLANITRHVLDLGDRLLAHLDEMGIGIVGPRARSRRSHILVLDLPVADWLRYLESENVRVSPERGGIRVSFAMFNTPGEVDRLARIIAKGRAAKIGNAEQSPKSQPSEAR